MDDIDRIIAGMSEAQKRGITSARREIGRNRFKMLTYRDMGALAKSLHQLGLVTPRGYLTKGNYIHDSPSC